MKFTGLMLGLLMLCAALAGCVPVNRDDTAVPSASGDEPQQQTAASYTVMNGQILRQQDGDQVPVYDAARYYHEDWPAWVGSLVVQEDALFFTEASVFSDGISCICETEHLGAAYAVVRTLPDGSGRQVLVSKNEHGGYRDIALFNDIVFYVEGHADDSVTVGYLGKDGSADGVLDLAPYGAYGAVLGHVVLKPGDEALIISAEYYKEGTAHQRVLRVDADMDIAEASE